MGFEEICVLIGFLFAGMGAVSTFLQVFSKKFNYEPPDTHSDEEWEYQRQLYDEERNRRWE